MMMRVVASAGAFVAVNILGWFIIWLGGFDFNDRNPGVAYMATVLLFFGCFAGVAVFSGEYWNRQNRP
jgi:hypothetical protein